jgi:geranylgeranyl diphosphate synthase, type I
MRMSLTQLASHYLPALEDELRRIVGAGPGHLREYYAMLEYHLGWVDETGAGQRSPSGGKRIRPMLCLLSCAAAGGQWQSALPIAAAIELLHNFSLIHDDIQDNSPLRRGRPAVWKRWGQAQAINAGDAMFTMAHLAPHALATRGVYSDVALSVLEEFDRTCLRLTQGQYLDMSFEQRERVGVAEYLEMIECKTAALLAAATYLGARLGGADDGRAAHFYQYGRNLGLAFQIQDDLLGLWGDPAITGKSAASDLEKRKKSLPVVYGLEHSAEFARAYARRPAPNESVAALSATLEALGARQYTEKTARDLTAEAIRNLEAAAPAGEAGAALRELTGQLLKRNR